MEVPKKNPGEKSDEEVRRILEEAAKKEIKPDDSGPALSEEALKAVRKNIEKEGKVWEEGSETPSDNSDSTP